MTEEITELDNKYLVLKWEDIEKLRLSQFLDAVNFAKAVQKNVAKLRADEGKTADNRYLVLNLDDEIDIDYLQDALTDKYAGLIDADIKVKDIAVGLVNAILKAKQERL